VKYGFSLGPHATLKEDFTIDSSTMRLKHINKSHLEILELSRIVPAYLVDGSLNLVVRFTSYFPQTQPVVGSPVQKMAESSGDLTIQNCSSLSVLIPPKKKESEDMDGDGMSSYSNGSTTPNHCLETPRGHSWMPVFSSERYDDDGGRSTDTSSSSCSLPVRRGPVRSKPLRKSKKQLFLSMKKDAQRTSLNYED